MGHDPHAIDLSVVAPALDEGSNLEPLYHELVRALGERRWELILVDDCSRDGTPDVIRRLSARDSRVRGALLEHHCGQTAATKVGIDLARGRWIATLDADLQNDPADLPALLERCDGWDAVVGYRERRHDSRVRRLSSHVANRVRNRLTGDDIRDTGCSLKLFRTDAIREVPLFDGMHRFLPTLLRQRGFRVLEHPVAHRPRIAGESKYGISNRAWRGFLDLLAVCWMRRRVIHAPVREVVEPDR